MYIYIYICVCVYVFPFISTGLGVNLPHRARQHREHLVLPQPQLPENHSRFCARHPVLGFKVTSGYSPYALRPTPNTPHPTPYGYPVLGFKVTSGH